jgi:hypothetical protein
MQYFHSFTSKKLFYECKDIPLFHHFHSREMAAFKFYFWQKFLFNQQTYKSKKFSVADYPDEIYEAGRKVMHLYYTMPSVEFWNAESINSFIRQIDFFYDTGSFNSKDEAAMIYQSLLNLIVDIEQMSAKGEKPPVVADDINQSPGSYEVYNNEVVLGGNTILAIVGSGRMVYLNHTVFNYAVTTDLNFGMYIQHYMENLAKSSTQLSQVSEVERTSFFSSMRQNIEQKIKAL